MMAVVVLPHHGEMFPLNDIITDEGASCLVFERKGTIQSFCESGSAAVNKVAVCGSNN